MHLKRHTQNLKHQTFVCSTTKKNLGRLTEYIFQIHQSPWRVSYTQELLWNIAAPTETTPNIGDRVQKLAEQETIILYRYTFNREQISKCSDARAWDREERERDDYCIVIEWFDTRRAETRGSAARVWALASMRNCWIHQRHPPSRLGRDGRQ